MSFFLTAWRFWSIAGMKAVAHVQLLHMYKEERVCVYVRVCARLLMSAHLTGPWCRLMSVSASAKVKDAAVIHQGCSGVGTICHCSDGFSIPERRHVQAVALKGCLCVSHSLTLSLSLSHTHTCTTSQITLLELTTKTCLSNCGGIRLGYKETHKANVSISCSSESPLFE